MPESNGIQIQCPKCGTPFRAPVVSIIDVGREPELRATLLSGELNVATCPKCKAAVAVEVPLVYHDPAASFLGVYLPAQVNLPEMERQKLIGEMTQALMRSLPLEQRKGYFLNPRQFINRQSFHDAILGTMGISQEELDRQRRKMKLLDQAMVMSDDPKGLQMLAKEQDALLDYEFFILLSKVMDQSATAGDQDAVRKLTQLREDLLALTSWGRKVARQQEAVGSLREVKSPEEMLERILAADVDTVDAMVMAARPLIDYGFFQMLTQRVEASAGAERERLVKLREHLLETTKQIDDATRASYQEASDLLRDMLQTNDVRTMVREHADELDDIFMAVLSLNMQEAEKKGARDALRRLQAIANEVMAMVEEGMPPEVQLINDLLRADYPEGTRTMLRERRGLITAEVLELIDRMATEMAQRQDAEVAKRLRDIRSQAMLLV